MDERFNAIVVGGGLAGCAAAYNLALEGMEVLLIERGNYAGAKNMTGGRLYAHCFAGFMLDFAERAPLERKIVHEKISMMTDESATTIDYYSTDLLEKSKDSYAVLRGVFDRWFFDEAEQAGAITATGIKVDDLLMRDGRVYGVICGNDEMEADVVILADGINSPLAQKARLATQLKPHQAAVGLKCVFQLPPKTISDRFNTDSDDEGAAWLFAGSPSQGLLGGGFCYTNKESISVGLVVGLKQIGKSCKPVTQLLNDFADHPIVSPLLADAKPVEYSAHALTEAGYSAVPTLYGDGVLVVGDAAGLCINIGYIVRGMDFAVSSGFYAAKAVVKAYEKQDFSASSLAVYKEMLDSSYVMKDLYLYRNFPTFMENERIFNEYPTLVNGIMKELFVVDGQPAQPLMRKMGPYLKRVGILKLAKDAQRGVRSL